MSWNPINETTIITPFYNTRPEYFLGYLTSLAKFPDVPIIIGNDGSDKQHTDMLHNMVQKYPNITVIDFKENIGMCGTLYKLIKAAAANGSKYVLKCDSDDGIHHFPEFSSEDNSDDYDALIVKNCKLNAEHFLATKGNGPGGSLYKTEVYLELYRDWSFMDRNEKWIHEDVWMHLNLTMLDFKIEHDQSQDPTKIYEYKYARPGSMTAGKQLDKRSPKCETFLLWARYHNMRPQLYHKIQREINQLRSK